MSAQPRWDHTEPASRRVEVRVTESRAAEPEQNAARIVSVIALASIAAGAINIAAATTIAHGSAQNLAFFWVVGIAQLVWGAVALVWAPRWWLTLGALGNAVVVATWVVSRTVGLPFGAFAGDVLPVGFPDTLSTIFEAAIVVGATGLAVRGSAPARSACPGIRARGRGADRRAGPCRRDVTDRCVRIQRRWRWRPERPDRALRWRRSGRKRPEWGRLRWLRRLLR